MPSAPPTPDPLARLPDDPGNRRWAAAFVGIVLIIGVVAVWPWGWDIDRVEGSAPCFGPCSVDEGDTFAQEDGDVWRIEVGDVGSAEVFGNARFGRVDVDEGVALSLDQGGMTVESHALAREFVIVTPAARVVDLGCAFTVFVSLRGTSVTVEQGTVALESPQGTTVVAAGSAATAVEGGVPGLPIRDDAPDDVRAAATSGDVPQLLAVSRPADAFTLWHILQRSAPADRPAVLDALERLIPGAVPADRTRLLALRFDALQGLWAKIAPVSYSAG